MLDPFSDFRSDLQAEDLLDVLGAIADKYPADSRELEVLMTAAAAVHCCRHIAAEREVKRYLAMLKGELSPRQKTLLEDYGLTLEDLESFDERGIDAEGG